VARNAAELIERNDFWKVFNDCLSPLPERTASAFTLREVDGLKSEGDMRDLEH
jgi:DNA-directed RNA polymerase specialized sigma24 family protein